MKGNTTNHPRKYARAEDFNELKEEIAEVKNLVFDLRDNHLKGICGRIVKLETNQRWLILISGGILIAVVAGLILERLL